MAPLSPIKAKTGDKLKDIADRERGGVGLTTPKLGK